MVRSPAVAGRLRRPAGGGWPTVARGARRYLDAAFLSGPYPRSDFAGSFGSFTPGAARRTPAATALLTNRRVRCHDRTSVRATRRTAYLSVLAPYKVCRRHRQGRPGVRSWTAASEPAQRVQLTGRLLLTRTGSGPWRIFGYDVARSDVRKGS